MKSDRLFIQLKEGNSYLDKLNGKSKVRTFFLFIVLLVATWDLRILLPLSLLFVVGIFSIKPSWKKLLPLVVFMTVMNLFNLLLIYLVSPNYGANIVGGSTILFRFNGFYIVTRETLWYFLVRFMKLFATFAVSMLFIQIVTPSQIASGLYSMKIPYKICTVVSIAFRYIPDITRDFTNIRLSVQARGMELHRKKTGLFKRLKEYVYILAPLMITSFDRISNIANAMDLRGFGKQKTRSYYAEHPDTKADKLFTCIDILLIVAIIAIIYTNITHKGWEVWSPWA